MTKFKLGFLKSSASSTNTPFLDSTSESPCDATLAGPTEPKRYFSLRRKRNNSQSQPLLDLGRWSSPASPLRAISPLTAVAAAPAITSSKNTTSSNETSLFHRQPQQQQSPPAEIQVPRQTAVEGQLVMHRVAYHFETIERVATIEALDAMEKHDQNFQESESPGRKKTLMGVTEIQKISGGVKLRSTLSSSHSTASVATDPPPPPYAARHAHEQHLRIRQSTDQRCEGFNLRHFLELLQRAARRVQTDRPMSQQIIFRSLAPLAVFLYLIGMGVVLPRQQRYQYSQIPEKNTSLSRMILLFFIGIASVLVALRGVVWLVGISWKAFCEVDLEQVFRRGECVDVDGRGMGEAELILGGMLM